VKKSSPVVWIAIVLMVVACVFIFNANQSVSSIQEELNKERYTRMTLEEELQKSKIRIQSLQEDLSSSKKKIRTIQSILSDGQTQTKDLIFQLEDVNRANRTLEKKIKEIEMIQQGQAGI